MKLAIRIIILLVLLTGSAYLIYQRPYAVADKMLLALKNQDKDTFDAHIDFAMLDKNVDTEYIKHIVEEYNIRESKELYDHVALMKRRTINSSRFFTSIYILPFKIRAAYLNRDMRYVSWERFAVKFSDREKPLKYASWTLCRTNLIDWKLCSITVPNRAWLINKQDALKPYFADRNEYITVRDNMNLTKIYDGILNLIGNNATTPQEFFNVLEDVYGPPDQYSSPGAWAGYTKEWPETRIALRSAFTYQAKNYIVADRLQKRDNESMRCANCQGQLAVYIYDIGSQGVRILKKIEDIGPRLGHDGRSGDVLPVFIKDKKRVGFVVYTYQTQPEDLMKAHIFEITENGTFYRTDLYREYKSPPSDPTRLKD